MIYGDLKVNFKTYSRTLEIDFDNKIYKDKPINKTNKGRGYFIISIITYWELKEFLRKKKFKRIKENHYEKNI